MPRQGWSIVEGAAFKRRLDQLVDQRYRGDRAKFIRACGAPANTVKKWFIDTDRDGKSVVPRAPDSASLRKVAKRLDVSLDWLMLDRGTMAYPQSSKTSRQELFDAVMKELVRTQAEMRANKYLVRDGEKRLLERLGPDGLWIGVITQAPSMMLAAAAANRFWGLPYFHGPREIRNPLLDREGPTSRDPSIRI
jgi:hypothetical protein